MKATKTINVTVSLREIKSKELNLTFDPTVDDIDGFLQENLQIKPKSIKNVLIKDSAITG